MDEVQGPDGVVWTWGADTGYAGDAGVEAARVEEEWAAAGLTVRRPAVAAISEEAPNPEEEEWWAAGLTVRRSRLPPPEEVARAEEDWEAAGVTTRRPIVPVDRLHEAPSGDARREEPEAVADPGQAPTPPDESEPVDQMGSATWPDQAEGWNGPQGGAQWQQQAQPTPGQWPGQEPWPHDGGHYPEPAEQTWHHQPAGPSAASAPAPAPETPSAWAASASTLASTPAAHGVDPAYTWRGERGELSVWDGYEWVLQPETAAASLPVPDKVSAQPQPPAEHTWEGPSGEYWVWDGYQWVQRERPSEHH